MRFSTCGGLAHPEITKLYAISFSLQLSLPAFRRGNSTHRNSGNVTDGHRLQLISSTKSFFGISYRQLSMPKDLTIYRKTNVYQPLSHDQRIKIHHSYSCKLSVVHTRWRRNSLTIDMLKFTDVTASHVYFLTLCLFFGPVSYPTAKLHPDSKQNLANI